MNRRQLLARLGGVAAALPFLLDPRRAHAVDARARRAIFFYFPDGIPGRSADGEPSEWHCTGRENEFALSPVLEPLGGLKNECLFFNGLSMGATDAGSHPGGAQKLLTAVDHGNGESIDHYLARTVGGGAPFRHVYLGAMANVNNASGDKHISYPGPGQSIAPEDDPVRAFERLFGAGVVAPPAPGPAPAPGSEPPPARPDRRKSVLDVALADLNALRGRVGPAERARLDIHAESLRELERRIDALAPERDPGGGGGGAGGEPGAAPTCDAPSLSAGDLNPGLLYAPERFPDILRLQMDVLVQAMACGLTQVGVIQCSVHTSELIMSRFPGTEMHDPGYDMRSHQASHYGPRHDRERREYRDYVAQRRWYVAQFAALLDALRARPEGDGSMLDYSLVFCGTEVSDGNTHLHDDMPFLLAGRAGGAINPGRLLQFGYERHGRLFVSMAQAMGDGLGAFGDAGGGPLPGVLG
ncbi:DUF1552 domain-containing protein [Myxococcota bacterium]|nr:DUF1552 domain-containing protein [Myxococcota bacterium]